MLRAQLYTQVFVGASLLAKRPVQPREIWRWTKVFVSKLTHRKISVQRDAACSCDAERHELHSHASVETIVNRPTSSDLPRQV
ncbi:hypothetical protein BKM14_16845 [Pseudomonas syringae pv. syringae]|nr:hypothetical protein BKM14_16845 [Pseudomonas syringae pv. syringae]